MKRKEPGVTIEIPRQDLYRILIAVHCMTEGCEDSYIKPWQRTLRLIKKATKQVPGTPKTYWDLTADE